MFLNTLQDLQLKIIICPHRDLNPGLGDEDPVSWTGLDDGGYGLFNIYSEF